jgi:hypothetical protein
MLYDGTRRAFGREAPSGSTESFDVDLDGGSTEAGSTRPFPRSLKVGVLANWVR